MPISRREMKTIMSLSLILILGGVVSVLSQSTQLDSRCDNECFFYSSVEIQRLAAIMERNIKDTNDRFEKIVKDLGDKNDDFQNQIKGLESKLTDQNNVLTKTTQLESAAVSSTPDVMDSTTQNVLENSTSEDCEDIRSLDYNVSGVYGVNAGNGQMTRVNCEMMSGRKIWTRILHRQDNLTDFTFKKWMNYEAGFGDAQGSHWMGLVQMHQLTTSREYKMRVDLMDWVGKTAYAEYSMFRVGSISDKYRLSIGGYSGTAGDSMTYTHNNMLFTTIDQDNDLWPRNYAEGTDPYTGGWLYQACANARLTGTYLESWNWTGGYGIRWPSWRGDRYSYKVATMKIQRL